MALNQMHSGALVDLSKPSPASIDINDIAHHLAGINRYNGGTHGYSVAQHSCILHDIQRVVHADCGHSPDDMSLLMLAALLHDAHEAYVGDFVNPCKQLVPEFEERLGRPWMAAVMTKYDVPAWAVQEAMKFDGPLLVNEMNRFMLTGAPAVVRAKFGDGIPGIVINPWGAEESEKQFLMRFHRLVKETGNA